MKVMPRLRALVLALLVSFVLLHVQPAAAVPWDLGTLAAGKAYPTTIAISNASCPGVHTLELSRENLDWVQIVDSPTLTGLPAGKTQEVKLLVDLRDKKPGSYRGNLKVRCLTCKRGCSQDVGVFEILVKVSPAPSDLSTATPAPRPELPPAATPALKPIPERLRMATSFCQVLDTPGSGASQQKELESWRAFCEKDQSHFRVYVAQCEKGDVAETFTCSTTWLEQWVFDTPSCEGLPYLALLCERIGGKYSQWVSPDSFF